MPSLSPPIRISLGLVMITISLLLGADMLIGVNPDQNRAVLDSRKQLTESMAVQAAILANANRFDIVQEVIAAVVERNDDLLSAGVRDLEEGFLAQAGDHERQWGGGPQEGSTPTHTRVDIFRGSEPWGVLEMRFAEQGEEGTLAGFSLLSKLVGFVAVLGFAAYLLFMKRTLRHLDPASVIPERVKATLDVLSEGVVLVDASDQVVLANSKFGAMLQEPREKLLGRKLSGLPWRFATDEEDQDLPWKGVLDDGEPRNGATLRLPALSGSGKGSGESQGQRVYVVNSAPILDDRGTPRGALATFDDVSEIERQNVELERLLEERKAADREIRRQNERLEYLATRDPLTDCLNRRALFDKFERETAQAHESGESLSCIMCDIDHFKSVNDNFGHGVGDEVIRFFADTLRATLRSIDIIGRYGGEEFCIVLPGLDLDEASEQAERVRARIERDGVSSLPPDAGRLITASFGVSRWEPTDETRDMTVARADEALYASKTGGRNRVTRTDELSADAGMTA